jgi:hypothetical protein
MMTFLNANVISDLAHRVDDGSKYIAALSYISGRADAVDEMTGVPKAIASNPVKPNPSENEG